MGCSDILAASGGALVAVNIGQATDAFAVTIANNAPAAFPLGVTTVTYSATDAAGNTSTATQTVTVADTTPPALSLPMAITITSGSGSISVNIGQATATDAFAVTVSNNAPVVFPIGMTTVTWTAVDANGNRTSGPQTVTVNLVDTTAPVISVPADVFTSTNAAQATVNLGTATAVDNVDGIVAVTNNAPAVFPVGVTTVIYTASDLAGNTATATQRVVVSFVSTVGGGIGGGGNSTLSAPGGGATVTTEAVYWHHNDHLGTPQALTDANGRVVWTASYTPFGIATVNEDPDGDGIRVTNNFRLPGQYYDAETGLNYNYQRTYDPATGRYTQHDPIGLNGGMNPFGYVGGNPVTGVDPYGLDTFVVNRDLSVIGNKARSRSNFLTHTFTVVTNPDGSINHTYSWGNDANLNGWNLDQPLDVLTAKEALDKGLAEKVAGPEFDAYVGQAFMDLNKPQNQHINGIITNNCKTETSKLIDRANFFQFLGSLGNASIK